MPTELVAESFLLRQLARAYLAAPWALPGGVGRGMTPREQPEGGWPFPVGIGLSSDGAAEEGEPRGAGAGSLNLSESASAVLAQRGERGPSTVSQYTDSWSSTTGTGGTGVDPSSWDGQGWNDGGNGGSDTPWNDGWGGGANDGRPGVDSSWGSQYNSFGGVGLTLTRTLTLTPTPTLALALALALARTLTPTRWLRRLRPSADAVAALAAAGAILRHPRRGVRGLTLTLTLTLALTLTLTRCGTAPSRPPGPRS